MPTSQQLELQTRSKLAKFSNILPQATNHSLTGFGSAYLTSIRHNYRVIDDILSKLMSNAKNNSVAVSGFWHDQNGNTAVIFALSLVAIVTVIGIGFDFSRSQGAKTSIQNAADAAALAIARDPDITPQNLQSRATDFFNANMVGHSFGVNYSITASELSEGAGVSVAVSAEIDTTFSGMVGIPHFAVNTIAEVLYSTTKIELVLALDNTGSMGSNGKIEALRSASHDLIDQLLPEGAAQENVKIGVVPFNYMVRLPTSFKTESWMRFDYVSPNNWNGCIAPRKKPHDTKDSNPNTNAKKFRALPGQGCPEQALTTLTNDRDLLHNTIDQMEANNWTYVPEGLAWGWRVLSKKKPVVDGVGYNDQDWTKIMVLMTDGANTVRWKWPGGHPSATLGTSSATGDLATERLCDRIKAKGILLYTIAFDVGNTNTEDMLLDCATDPGMYFDAENNAQLEVAFSRIAGDISNLRLSR
ncbi:MAG: hypothetical protein COA47_02250 [Robiginitomaculum sp.]|nr:MAG: hypothetical protein COA47_02250 [Robiginitomaculum sp.]